MADASPSRFIGRGLAHVEIEQALQGQATNLMGDGAEDERKTGGI